MTHDLLRREGVTPNANAPAMSRMPKSRGRARHLPPYTMAATPMATTPHGGKNGEKRLHGLFQSSNPPLPGDVGNQAASHPRQDAEGDVTVARPSGAFLRNVVVQVGADLVDPTLGDRSRELPRVEPHPPRSSAPHSTARCVQVSVAASETLAGIRARR